MLTERTHYRKYFLEVEVFKTKKKFFDSPVPLITKWSGLYMYATS